jgi:hypothetical protein
MTESRGPGAEETPSGRGRRQRARETGRPQERAPEAPAEGEAREEADTAVEAADGPRPTEGLLAAVVAAGALIARAPWAGYAFGDRAAEAAPRLEEAPSGAGAGVPAQTPTVDRASPLDIVYVDTPVPPTGPTAMILRRERSFPSGPLPGDPSQLIADVSGPTALCHVLSAGAAARCRGSRR